MHPDRENAGSKLLTKRATLSLLLFCLCAHTSLAQTLRFTAIPDENSARLEARFNKVATYLAERLHFEVEYIPVKSYSASLAAFKNNQVQLAWFGGLSGVQARRAVPGSRAIAQGAEDRDFVTYFIAHSSTQIEPADQFPTGMRDMTFTFGAKGSTSGRLMPEYFIRKHLGRPPSEVFKRVGFSGDHSKTLTLVQSGSWQLGAVNYKVWENELKAGNVDTSNVRVIWRTPTYPDYNWTIRGDVETAYGAGFIEKIQTVLIEMADRNLLDSFPRTRFVKADNAMFQPILEIAQEIGIIDK